MFIQNFVLTGHAIKNDPTRQPRRQTIKVIIILILDDANYEEFTHSLMVDAMFSLSNKIHIELSYWSMFY